MVGKADILRDLGERLVGIEKQVGRPLDSHALRVILDSLAGLSREQSREVGGTQPQAVSDIIQIDLLPVVRADTAALIELLDGEETKYDAASIDDTLKIKEIYESNR